MNEIHLTFIKKQSEDPQRVLTESKAKNTANGNTDKSDCQADHIWALIQIKHIAETYIDFQITKIIYKSNWVLPHETSQYSWSESSEEEHTLDGFDENCIQIKAESEKDDSKSLSFRSDSDYDISDIYIMKPPPKTSLVDRDNLQYVQPQHMDKKDETSWIDILDFKNSKLHLNSDIVKLSNGEIISELKKLKVANSSLHN